MPSVTLNLYDKFRQGCFNGNAINMTTATIKCALVTVGYTPDQNLHEFWSDVSANEVSGTNYTAGGNVCSTGTVTLDATGVVTVDFADPATWLQSATGFSNARRAIFYEDTGNAATSRLIAYTNDFGSDQGNVNGDFTIQINASGLFTSSR